MKKKIRLFLFFVSLISPPTFSNDFNVFRLTSDSSYDVYVVAADDKVSRNLKESLIKIIIPVASDIHYDRTTKTAINERINDPIAEQQSMSDQDQIISQCLAHKQFESNIPEDVTSQMTHYYILDNGVEFNFSASLKINGKQTSLFSPEDINLKKSYFQFDKVAIVNNTASVECNFVYVINGKENILSLTIDFGKTNSEWSELNHYIATK